MERSDLRRVLDKALTADSLRVLCHHLGVDHDNLAANNKVGRIRELIGYLERHGRIVELHTLIETNRLPDHNAKLHLTRQERLRQRALFNVRSTWIEGVLDHLVSDELYLTLGLEYKPTAVAKRTLRTASQADTPIPEGKPISEIFAENGRSLLILGAPGSGKTITLLQLGRDLINEALQNPEAPLPFVVNLSSWATKRGPLADWLVEELFLQYQLSRKLARSWLAEEQLTLLLDGLDEVAEAQRGACVEAINRFKGESDVEIVVCSRLADYKRLERRLNVATAVVIQPLTDEQVDVFLSREELELTAVRANLQLDEELRELSKYPFFLNIMVVAYQGMMVADLELRNDGQTIRRLFQAYVEYVFRHRPLIPRASYTKSQAQHWLSQLAAGMVLHKQSLFYLELLQPTWMPAVSKRSYRLVRRLIGEQNDEIELSEEIVWAGPNNFLWLRDGLIFGLISGLISGLSFWLITGRSLGLIIGLIFGLIGGLSGGLIFRLEEIAKSQEIQLRTQPNQGIKLSRNNAFKMLLFVGLFVGLGVGLITGLSGGLIVGFRDGLIFGLVVGLFVGLFGGMQFGLLKYGGAAVIQHYTVRYFLARANILPYPFFDKKLIAFLDAMAERLILRRVGGGWIFVHRILLEYFAELTPEDIEESTRGSE